jgi:hypothetical protein
MSFVEYKGKYCITISVFDLIIVQVNIYILNTKET